MSESVLLVPFPEVAKVVGPWLEQSVSRRLRLRGRAREAVLPSEVEPERWEPQARFQLQGA